jgi:hypothetical protein
MWKNPHSVQAMHSKYFILEQKYAACGATPADATDGKLVTNAINRILSYPKIHTCL